MPKISFNANALGFASDHQSRDMSHSKTLGPAIANVAKDVSVEAIFKGLGFADIKGFPTSGRDLTAEDVDR